MSNESNRLMEDEIERIFDGQTAITKDKMKHALEEFRMRRGRGAMNRPGPMHDEMRQKLSQLLESELDKIDSNTITKEQAKSTLVSFSSQAKDQWHAHVDNYVQTSIKDEFKKLNVHEVNANQARDLLRNIRHQMRPSHSGGPSMLDENIKQEFMNEYKNKHGTNKVDAEEVWEMVKVFDKKQHDKMGCCDKKSDWDNDKDKKWEELFDEQYKELFGDLNKTKINEQQLEDLAKKIKDKLRQECPQHPGKRFCQH